MIVIGQLSSFQNSMIKNIQKLEICWDVTFPENHSCLYNTFYKAWNTRSDCQTWYHLKPKPSMWNWIHCVVWLLSNIGFSMAALATGASLGFQIQGCQTLTLCLKADLKPHFCFDFCFFPNINGYQKTCSQNWRVPGTRGTRVNGAPELYISTYVFTAYVQFKTINIRLSAMTHLDADLVLSLNTKSAD